MEKKDRAKLKRSKSTPKKNSEEFLMYQLKQHKKSAQEVLDELMNKINSVQENIDNKLDEFIRANGHTPFGMSKEEMFKTLTKQQREAIKENTEYWQKLIHKLPEKIKIFIVSN
jgi:low affinity Fe/Cu permease